MDPLNPGFLASETAPDTQVQAASRIVASEDACSAEVDQSPDFRRSPIYPGTSNDWLSASDCFNDQNQNREVMMVRPSWARFCILLCGFFTAGCLVLAPLDARAQDRQRPQESNWVAVLTLARVELFDPTAWTAEDVKVISEHVQYHVDLAQKGTVVLGGPTGDTDERGRLVPGSFGLIILSAPDRETAQAIMNSDPAIKAGLMTASLHSFTIAMER